MYVNMGFLWCGMGHGQYGGVTRG